MSDDVVYFANSGEPLAVSAPSAPSAPSPGPAPVVRPSGELDAQWRYARALAMSNLLPPQYVGKPENVLVAISYGDALGIPPIQAINSINVIKGKPTLSAGLMSALVRRAGHALRVFVENEGTADVKAVAELQRAGDEFVFRCVWTLGRAERAGLGGVNWQKYPEAMLKARAISEVCREGAEDVLAGLAYTPEELGGDSVG